MRHDEDKVHRDDLADAIRHMPKLPRSTPKIDRLRWVLEHGAARIDGVMVDRFSASAIVQVYDALSEKNKANYLTMSVRRMAEVAFKIAAIGRQSKP